MAAPTASERGPFSYDSYTLDGTTSNDDPADRKFDLTTRTTFDPSINETIELILDGVKLLGSGGTDSTGGGDEFFVDSLTTPTRVTIVPNATLLALTPSSGNGSTVTTLGVGNKLVIRRISNRTSKNVDYAPGSVIREVDLDSSNTQIIHVAQEAMDIAIAGMVLEANDKFDSKSKVIENVADGVADNDAVNIGQLEVHDAAITADLALTNSDVVLTHADVVLTHADEVLTRADTVLTAADVVTTNADVVTTNANVVAANASADAVSEMYDAFNDTYLGAMSDSATATDADTTGIWAINSSVITVASATNIIVGQEVTGIGIPTDANVIVVDGTSITISGNMAAAGSGVALDFRGQGVYGAFNGGKDGPATDNDGGALADGMLYFNTSDDVMMVYDETSSAWKRTTPTSSEQTAINAVNADASDIGAVAGKATEIGRLGTVDAVADMAILGSTTITDDMALLAVPDVITDMGLLGATGVIGDIETVADNVASVSTTATNIADVNNFADVYQIDDFSPSAPTTDGGGNAVAKGDLAFDTTANVVKAYNGSEWIVATVADVALLAGATFTGAVVFDNTLTTNSTTIFNTAPVFNGGIKEQASTNITGTITDTYYLSLAYVLTGDVTLSGTNILGKVADGTTNISLTNDGSTRTISGSGTLILNGLLLEENKRELPHQSINFVKHLQTGTDGELITWDASGNPAAVAVGTSSHVLTSGGAGVAPTFQAAAGGGITHASQWRIHTGFAGSAAPIGGSGLPGHDGWEEVDAPVGFGVMGASMTEADGIFTFPTDGYWLVDFKPRARGNAGAARCYCEIFTTTDNSTYATTGVAETWLAGTNDHSTAYTNYIFDVTSTSTHKVQFRIYQDNSSNTFIATDTNNYNSVSFIRIGAT